MNNFIKNIKKSIVLHKFKETASRINSKNRYMCLVLAGNSNKARAFEKFGFNKSNYHNFIIYHHYSHLIPLLRTNDSTWILCISVLNFKDVLSSKRDFLLYLADNLDKELKSCKYYKLYMKIGKILYKII